MNRQRILVRKHYNMKWIDIKSAPKDGTSILVKDEEGDVYLVAWLDDNEGMRGGKMMSWCVPESWQDEQGGYYTVDNVVKWMPLPK